MPHSLQLLFTAISQVKDEADLRSLVASQIGEYFAAKRSGIFFFDQLPLAQKLAEKDLQKLQKGLSIDHNPVLRYLVERHTPVHELLVTSPKVWRLICPRADHWHVMAGPIVSRGQLIGAVGCTREQSMSAFDAQDLADLSAVCLHLSVWAATVRSQQPMLIAEQWQKKPKPRLTPRELQIAELVALGRTNAEIGAELWITENSVKQALKRMFRKLEVASRTEMVALLAATQSYLLLSS